MLLILFECLEFCFGNCNAGQSGVTRVICVPCFRFLPMLRCYLHLRWHYFSGHIFLGSMQYWLLLNWTILHRNLKWVHLLSVSSRKPTETQIGSRPLFTKNLFVLTPLLVLHFAPSHPFFRLPLLLPTDMSPHFPPIPSGNFPPSIPLSFPFFPSPPT